jgi:hypothetical protein
MDRYDQPLLVKGQTVLPSSLLHLVMPQFTGPLLADALPSALQRICLDRWNGPLEVGVFPASLKALMLGDYDHPLLPGALPLGLTHMSLDHFSHPLTLAVCLPPSSPLTWAANTITLCFQVSCMTDTTHPTHRPHIDAL